MALQSEICQALEALDGQAAFSDEQIRPPNGGWSQPRVLADGAHIEKAAVQPPIWVQPFRQRQPNVIHTWRAALSRLRPFR